MTLYTNKSDGSYDYIQIDSGLMYFRNDDLNIVINKL